MIIHIDDKYSKDMLYIFYQDNYETLPKSIYKYQLDDGEEETRIIQGMKTIKVKKVNKGKYETTLSPKIRFINTKKLYPNYEVNKIKSMAIDAFFSPDNKILSISYKYDGLEEILYNQDETIIIESLKNSIKGYDPDIIVGYNIDSILDKLLQRAKKLDINMDIGRYELENKSTLIPGRVVFDLHNLAELLSKFGILDLDDYSLSHIYNKIFNKSVELELNSISEANPSFFLARVRAIYDIYKMYLPLIIELANLSRMYLQDLIKSYPSKMVENLIISEAYGKFLIPEAKEELEEESYSGGYVLTPKPGIYENIAVLDFASMYPSIIISNNIDYYTYENGLFLREPMGLIPRILKDIIDQRLKIKALAKEYKDSILEIRSQALKILANAFYGYMAYRRARFYIKQGAEKVTEIGREMIKKVITKADYLGFKVLYADTDSIFITYNNKEDIYSFINLINQELEGMKLELEGFYKKAIFVAKRNEDVGAKKKYALLREDGYIKIRGFELIRRDWCKLARDLQRKIIEIILKENDINKAVAEIKEVINNLKSNKIDPKFLIINKKLNKNLNKYDRITPELVAARKLIFAGYDEKDIMGDVVKYIIIEGNQKIAERAEPYELYIKKELKYDSKYYIENQILPAAISVLALFDYNEEMLI